MFCDEMIILNEKDNFNIKKMFADNVIINSVEV